MVSETITIKDELDIVQARKSGRDTAQRIGFRIVDCVKIAAAISELARNIFFYAGSGTITISNLSQGNKRGVEIVAEDSGPGIEDVELVMRDGYSTSGGMGIGLPGTQRLMDEFEIDSTLGKGTRIRTVKWISGH